MKQSSPQEVAEMFKSMVRPVIIVWGCTVYGLCVLTEIEVPTLLAGLVSAVIIEYFGERAIKRLKEK